MDGEELESSETPQPAKAAEKGLGILQQTGIINQEKTGLGVNAARLDQPEPDIGTLQNMEVLKEINKTGKLGRLIKVGEKVGNPVMEDPESGEKLTLKLKVHSEGEAMAALPPPTFTQPNLDRFMYQRERTNIAGFTEQERGAMVDVINTIPGITADQGFDLVRFGSARIDLQAAVERWTKAYWDWDNNHDLTSKGPTGYLENMGLYQLYRDAFMLAPGRPGRDALGRSETRALIEGYPGVSAAMAHMQSAPRTRGYWESPIDPVCVAFLRGSGLGAGTATVATQLAKKLLIVSGEADFPNSHFINLPGIPGYQAQARVEAVQGLSTKLLEMFQQLLK